MSGYNDLWDWFGLSRASWLTIPRSFMHQMPDEWQAQMAKLLTEFQDTYSGIDLDFSVTARKDGKLTKIPEYINNYRHPDTLAIDKHKKLSR